MAQARGSAVQPLRDARPLLSTPESLRAQLRRDGYLYIPNLLPREAPTGVRDAFLRVVRAAGWVREGDGREVNPEACCFYPHPNYLRVHQELYMLEEMHALPHHPALHALMETIVGAGNVFVHPRHVIHMIFPNPEGVDDEATCPHQDFPHFQGTRDTYAIWTPLHDCGVEDGVLGVAEGSSLQGVLPFTLGPGAGALEAIPPQEAPWEWRMSRMRTGDVLLFHSLCVHRAFANRSPRLRMAMSCRFQNISDPVCEEVIELKWTPYTWDTIYAGWNTGRALQYYWRHRKPPIIPLDRSFIQRRNALAFELGEQGDRRAIASLLRIWQHSPNDPALANRAKALLTRFQT
jgi:ectoine hydroxylase-related dioxygenase (phytanoyl-CoA dioxygenase family)